MPYHVEYCRQPAYKAKKKVYDKKRRDKELGDFAKAHDVILKLVKEIHRQMPDREARYAQAGRHGWSPITHQKRREKRAEARLYSDGL